MPRRCAARSRICETSCCWSPGYPRALRRRRLLDGGWALAPVNQVTGALARIGPRDLRQRLPLPRVHDEAGQLIAAINQLLERLELAVRRAATLCLRSRA